MKIGVLKESRQGEKRVALSPQAVKQLVQKGHSILVEKGAGERSAFTDAMYLDAGAEVAEAGAVFSSDILVKVNPFNNDEVDQMKEGQATFSLLYHMVNADLVQKLNGKGVSAFSMDAIPRISRAQSMDVLSSQSNLAGYKAVLLGANEMTKIFPMMMTAAGTVIPAKVLIYGVGVAGLQAIATAKRLGAVVEATDVRPETKEQAESLGAKFIVVEGETESEGGYAKEVTDEYKRKQKEAVNKSLFAADLVITTALVPGRKAPVLIDEDQVKQMKFGSVIVDMAAEQGGNCTLAEAGKIVEKHGVRIMGLENLPSMLATNASELYAKNLTTFLDHLIKDDAFQWDLEEEITDGTLICHQGQIRKS
ncbi:MAG: Re/Si-specific NAD(P)(+) transhydrogenase subunit alpha [Flavobacteriales bacterium]|nr:Re/Si-specific NAD(P)(+) transhydrogenase subunit alpha [Bacteroidota bacterium]MCB9240828.1 Re/Si-specific NAD(P)(+) transhydrogenase subunit alpha [Flavobacteriales bacterium]